MPIQSTEQTEPVFGPGQCRAAREALGLSVEQAARRTGLATHALQRFEGGGGGLTEDQVAALRRAIGYPISHQAARKPRKVFDLGLVVGLILLVGGAIPGAAALVAGLDVLRFIGSGVAVARVVGFEHRIRSVEPETGDRYDIETVAPLFQFIRPDGGGQVTIAWHETLPEEARFAEGDRVRLIVPRGAPERAEISIADVLVRPFVFAAMAAPLLIIGSVSLRHWRRRRHASRV